MFFQGQIHSDEREGGKEGGKEGGMGSDQKG